MKSEKITNGLAKPRRWYQDACGTALAMELVGERWSILIMRELLLGPRRFGEIRAGLVGLSANVLTQRLESLEKMGILRRRMLPSPANTQVYELTRWGQSAEEAIFALSRWAAGSPQHDVTLPLSNTAFMLSLRTMMDAQGARGLSVDLGFRVGGEPFRARIEDGRLEIDRRDPAGAEIVFEGMPSPLAATFYGPAPLEQSQRDGKVQVTGDLALGQRFVDLFRLPRFEND
jgi:DNA-binding HxlR family transcriptional regulator